MNVYQEYKEEQDRNQGLFLRIQPGEEIRVRLLSEPIFHIAEFDGKKIRKWAWKLLDKTKGRDKAIRILDTSASTIMAKITAYALNDEYGDPKNYDLVIKRAGSGLETRYDVIASPKQVPLTDEEKELVAMSDIDLYEKLQLQGAGTASSPATDEYDPFGDNA